MLKNILHLSETKKKLFIEIPAEEIEKHIQTGLNDLRQKLRIPGYRPGKAPLSLIEKKFGKDVEADALEKIVSAGFKDAVKEAGITPIANPSLDETFDYKRHIPLNLTFTVEVKPKLDNIEYNGIKVKDIPVEVAEEEIENTLGRIREERAAYEPTEAEITPGNIVIYDMKSGGETYTEQIIKIGEPVFPADLSAGLIGKKKGDEFALSVNFPEHMNIKELAGKSNETTITVKEVKVGSLPDLDDEFAKDLNFDSLEKLKEHIKNETLKSKTETVKKIQKAEILKKLIESNEFEVPESLVSTESAQLLEEARTMMANQGGDFDEALFKKDLPLRAKKNIKSAMLIDFIGEKEKVDVSDDEMKKELASLSFKLRMTPENVIKYFVTRDGSLGGLKHSIYEEKVLSLLHEKAIIE